MFADDMALFVTNPMSSLAVIEGLLDDFQGVSGLHVNKEKSLIYPMKMSAVCQASLTQTFPYMWAQDTWKYLGVTIPLDFASFAKRNLEKVDSEVKTTLRSWNDKNLTWFERISIIKTLVFLKYLFLFRTAPLGITKPLLSSRQKTLIDFVWVYKKPRIPRQLLMAHKTAGGQALPNLELYYEASILSILLKHYNPKNEADWKKIEIDAFENYFFEELLWLQRASRPKLYTPSLICQATLKVWDKNRKSLTS